MDETYGKPHPEFNEIEVDPSTIKNPNYFNPDPATVNIPSKQPPISTGGTTSEEFYQIERKSKIVKWTSLILSIFSLLYLLPGAFPLIITIVFPIIGFVGAHKFEDCLMKFYSVYLILIMIVQIIVMAALRNLPYIVLQTLVMVGELVILIFNIKLNILVSKLPFADLCRLKNSDPRATV